MFAETQKGQIFSKHLSRRVLRKINWLNPMTNKKQ